MIQSCCRFKIRLNLFCGAKQLGAFFSSCFHLKKGNICFAKETEAFSQLFSNVLNGKLWKLPFLLWKSLSKNRHATEPSHKVKKMRHRADATRRIWPGWNVFWELEVIKERLDVLTDSIVRLYITQALSVFTCSHFRKKGWIEGVLVAVVQKGLFKVAVLKASWTTR